MYWARRHCNVAKLQLDELQIQAERNLGIEADAENSQAMSAGKSAAVHDFPHRPPPRRLEVRAGRAGHRKQARLHAALVSHAQELGHLARRVHMDRGPGAPEVVAALFLVSDYASAIAGIVLDANGGEAMP